MTTRPLTLFARRSLRHSRLLQIALLCGFWLAGEALVRSLLLPIPGGVAGLFIVLALLGSGRLRLGSMRRGADWLLAQMLLFFVPAVLAIIDHPEFLGWVGLKLLAVILLGTLVVMGVSALVVDLCCRWGAGHARAAAVD